MITDLMDINDDSFAKRSIARSISSFESDIAAGERARAHEQEQLRQGYEKNRELLASPGKLDNFIASNIQDIYPFTAKPKTSGAEVTTDAIESSIKDHPLAGSVKAIKEEFSAALADPRNAKVGHAQLLDSIKQRRLASPDETGKTLLERAQEYKYNKDNGPFRFFSDKGDDSVAKPLGYDEYLAKRKQAKPYDTSLAESIALNVGGTAAMIGLGALTGGTAPAAALALRLAGAAAIAYPEMQIFDAAANKLAANKPEEDRSVLAELGVGMAGLLLAHKVVGAGTGKVLAKAMKFEKTADAAASIARYTGKAPEALKSYQAGKAAKELADKAAVEASAAEATLKAKARSRFLEEVDTNAANYVDDLKANRGDKINNGIFSEYTRARTVDHTAAHMMGMTADEFAVAGNKPSLLYTYLSDDGIAAVDAAIKEGEYAEVAITRQFNQEAALKKTALLDSGTLTYADLDKQAREALKVKSYNEIITGKTKNKVQKAGKGKVTEKSIDELLTGNADNAVNKMESLHAKQARAYTGTSEPTVSVGTSSKIPTVDVNLGATVKPTGPSQAKILTGSEATSVAKGSGTITTDAVSVEGKQLAIPTGAYMPSHSKMITGIDSATVSGKSAKELEKAASKTKDTAKKVAGTVTAAGLAAGAVLAPEDSHAGVISEIGKVAGKLVEYTPKAFANEAIGKIKIPEIVANNLDALVAGEKASAVHPIITESILNDVKFLSADETSKLRLHRVDDAGFTPKDTEFSKSGFGAEGETRKPHGKYFAENPQDAVQLRGSFSPTKADGKITGSEVRTAASDMRGDLPQDFTAGRPAPGSVVAEIDERALYGLQRKLKYTKESFTTMLNDLGVTHFKINNVDGLKGTSEIIQIAPAVSNLRGRAGLYAAAGITAAGAMTASGDLSSLSGSVLADESMFEATEKSILSRITDFISPNEAAASELSAIKAVVPKVVGENLLGKTGDALTSLLEDIFGKGYVGLPVQKGQVTLNPPMRQVVTAPLNGRSTTAFNQVVRKTKSVFDSVVSWMSPNMMASHYANVNFKITNQMASMQTAIAHDTQSAYHVIDNILEPALKGENASAEIAKLSKPVQDRYNAVALPLRTIEIETAKAQSVIKKLEETLGAGSDDAAIKARIDEQVNKIKVLTEEQAKFAPELPKVQAEYEAHFDDMMTRFRTARISYAVENPALMKTGKYAALYSPEERAAVQQIQDVYSQYRARAVDAGMPVISGNFNHHSMDKTMLDAKFAERLNSLGIPVDSKSIALTSFLERSKYSKQMIPDIKRNLFEYIPDAERRINVAKLWDKTSENGWYAFSQNEFVKSNKVWNDFFERMKQAYNPQEQTLMNDVVNKYTSLETLRLLFMAPSAAFKHLFKNEGTWATLGFVNSMKHIPESLHTVSKNSFNEQLARLGMHDKQIPASQKELFVRAITKQRGMLSPLDGLEKDPSVVSAFDKWSQKLNDVGGVGIQAVEAFDRTHTVLAALDMAAKKGMTAEQAMSSIYDTILRNNFLGGGLNPAWMKNPKVRALMLFQGTPFKIMERRLLNAAALGNDVKTAFGVIKSRDVATNLKELQDLGRYMLGAQKEFKQNMIYDALTGTKDAFGSSVSAQFIREAVITGAVIGGGSAVGLDFHKHSLHTPFIKEGSSPELAVNPAMGAAWKTAFGPIGQDDKTFFPARFLQNYLKSTGGLRPLMYHKMERLTENDIPEIYKGSAWKYLFSVPAT